MNYQKIAYLAFGNKYMANRQTDKPCTAAIPEDHKYLDWQSPFGLFNNGANRRQRQQRQAVTKLQSEWQFKLC